MAYLYENNMIDDDKFKMVVTVFCVGHGAANMIEIYNGTILEQLILIDLGTTSSNRVIKLDDEADSNAALKLIVNAMAKRSASRLDPSFPPYVDKIFLTHQDEDHYSGIMKLIGLIDKNYPISDDSKRKYIGDIYLSGFNYEPTISSLLMNYYSNEIRSPIEGKIKKVVEGNIYHLTHDNAATAKKNEESFQPPSNSGKVLINLKWLISCLQANTGWNTAPKSPSIFYNYIDSKEYINFPYEPSSTTSSLSSSSSSSSSAPPSSLAEIHNMGSAIFQLYVNIPTKGEFSYIFTGDATHTTFLKFNKIDNLPRLGNIGLFTLPHHGSYNSSANHSDTTISKADKLDDFKAFIKKFKTIDHNFGAITASSTVSEIKHGHPNKEVLEAAVEFTNACAKHYVACFDTYNNEDDEEKLVTNKEFVRRIEVDKAIFTTEYILDEPKPPLSNEFSIQTDSFSVKRNHLRFTATKEIPYKTEMIPLNDFKVNPSSKVE